MLTHHIRSYFDKLMQKKIAKVIILLLMVMLVSFYYYFTSSTFQENLRARQVMRAVETYQKSLVEAKSSGDSSRLRSASARQRLQVEYDTQNLLKQHKVVKSRILKNDFLPVRGGLTKSYVGVDETWEYWHVDYRTRQVVKPRIRVSYSTIYNLIKENGEWKIDRVQVIRQN